MPQIGINTKCDTHASVDVKEDTDVGEEEEDEGVRFVTLRRNTSVSDDQWKWVICHLGIYVTDVYPDEVLIVEPIVDEETQSGNLSDEAVDEAKEEEELPPKPKISFGINSSGSVMPWDSDFGKLAGEHENYLEDLFVNRNTTIIETEE